MKTKLFALFALVAPLAFGHGSLATQASNAIGRAAEMFSTDQPKEIQKRFMGLSAVKTGHEKFQVTIKLDDNQTQFGFNCWEDESTEPVEWKCSAQD